MGLRESLAVDLSLAPEGSIGYGYECRGDASTDGWVQGVRVKVGDSFAGFFTLWVKVGTPPDDVVEVAKGVTAIIAHRGDAVIKFSEFDFVVATSTPGGVEVANVFLIEAFSSSFGGAIVDFAEPPRESFQTGSRSLTSPFGSCCNECGKVLVRRVYDGDILFLPLGYVQFIIQGGSYSGD